MFGTSHVTVTFVALTSVPSGFNATKSCNLVSKLNSAKSIVVPSGNCTDTSAKASSNDVPLFKLSIWVATSGVTSSNTVSASVANETVTPSAHGH